MRPKDLKSPYGSMARQVLIRDRIWYVPLYGAEHDSFVFPGWKHPDLFALDQPIKIEYCSGNGGWIAEKAVQEPHVNWIAIERKFTRVRRIWSKIKNLKLSNLLAVSGEGNYVTQRYFPAASVHEVFINFPDPWPKTRHIKHRIVQPSFVQEIARILQSNGVLTVVTDDIGYSAWTLAVLQKCPSFVPVHPQPFYVTEFPNYGTSYFEDLWRQKGKDIRYHQFRRI